MVENRACQPTRHLRGGSGRSVAHVLWSAGIGGVERLVVDLAAAQVDRGEDARIAFAQAAGQPAERAKNHGVPVVDLGMRSGFDLRPGCLRRAGNPPPVVRWDEPVFLQCAVRRLNCELRTNDKWLTGCEEESTPGLVLTM